MQAVVSSIESSLVRMPLQTAASFSTRSVAARDYVLVRIATEEGVRGIGLTYAGSAAGGIVQEAVDGLLAPLLIGKPQHLTAA